MENKYIIDEAEYYCLPKQNIIQYVTINNINNGGDGGGSSITGFDGNIENAGCTGDITSQENHILEVSGGLVSQKNIVFRTSGIGSLFRDDFNTTVKGDVRGLGANDLSISRTECDRVASGDYSVISGGQNNKASASNSVVSGGSNNIVDSTFSSIGGGQSNQLTSTSFNSFIGGGQGNTGVGSNSVIVGGQSNIISANTTFQSTGNFIGGGNNNLIRPLVQNCSVNFIGGGCNNTVIGNTSVITGGQGNTAGAGNFVFIGGGSGNTTYNSSLNAQGYMVIVGGQNNYTDSKYTFIGGGQGNQIITTAGTSTCDNSLIVGGQNNYIGDRGIRNSAIVGGTNNRIVYNANVRSNIFIGGGTNNTITNAEASTITGGTNNSILNNASNSAIPGGIGLTCSQANSCAVGAYNLSGTIVTTGFGFTGSGSLSNISVNSSRIFMVGNGITGGTGASNAFCVTNNGFAIARSGFLTSTSADFGEYMESIYEENGVITKIPVGTSVVINDDGFIMPSATLGLENKPVIGVISATSCLTANCQLEEWKDKYIHENGVYLYDEIQEYEEEQVFEDVIVSGRSNPCKKEILDTFNILSPSGVVLSTKKVPKKIKKIAYEKEYLYMDVSEIVFTEVFDYELKNIQMVEQIIYKKIPVIEEYDILDESGNFIRTESLHKYIETSNPKKRYQLKINPNFVSEQVYLPRPIRPEWNLVGLVGQVFLKNGQRTHPNWIKLRDINQDISLWLIK